MILYESDIQREGAIIDITTSNKSFIRMSILLSRMGVRNNKFFLALLDPSLQGVNPFDPKLTEEQKFRIGLESKRNPWYFIRECARVPSQGSDSAPFELNRANLAFMWCFLNSIDSFLTIPRQVGKTVTSLCILTWLMYIAGKNVNIGLFAKGNKLVLENVGRLKMIRNALPKYLIFPSAADTNNKEGIGYAALGNQYKTFVAQSDRKSAEDQGRGESFGVEHWDELCYYKNNDLSYPAATSASDTAAEQVRKVGLPACNIITTTAGRLSDPRGRFAFGIRSKCMRFTEKLYDCMSKAELEQVLNINSVNRMLYLEYSYLQLGKDQEWFNRVTRGKTKDEIARDYLCIWQHGRGADILPQHILDNLVAGLREPFHCTFVKSLVVRWYVPVDKLTDPKFKSRCFVFGGDTSDNVGADFTTIVMVDIADMAVVCTCRCNKSNLTYVADHIVQLLTDYPRAVWIPERNRSGAMLIDIVLTAMDGTDFNPFRRIYNTLVQNYNDSSPALSGLDTRGTNRKYFGFNTTGSDASRDLLYSNVLMTMCEMNHSRVYDTIIVDEIKSLTQRNGRIDHPEGAHDDMLIAWLLCGFFVLYGKNLEMYGISHDEFLSHMDIEGHRVDPAAKKYQQELRERIAQLEGLVETALQESMRYIYKAELRHLKTMVDEGIAVGPIATMNQVAKAAEDRGSSFVLTTSTPQSILTHFL